MEGIEIIDLNNAENGDGDKKPEEVCNEKVTDDSGGPGANIENDIPAPPDAPREENVEKISEIAEKVAEEKPKRKKPQKKEETDTKTSESDDKGDEKKPKATGDLKKKVQCPDCKKIVSKWNMLYRGLYKNTD